VLQDAQRLRGDGGVRLHPLADEAHDRHAALHLDARERGELGGDRLDAARIVYQPLAAEPTEWFNVALCIPDGEAIQQMSGEVSHFYRGITGRLGAGTPERYWHLDAWEQYTEPGRVHGFIIPDLLRLPQYSTPSLPREEESMDATYGTSLWPRLTSRLVKRGALIPPGYCLVEFWAQVLVDVCTIDHDGLPRGPREHLPRG
jgi:hypothetical protein